MKTPDRFTQHQITISDVQGAASIVASRRGKSLWMRIEGAGAIFEVVNKQTMERWTFQSLEHAIKQYNSF